MARKYINPNRPAVTDHEPAYCVHTHAHPAFGDEFPHLHRHDGDSGHAAGDAMDAAAAEARYPGFGRMMNLGGPSPVPRIMARARFGVPQAPPPSGDDPEPYGAALNGQRWARSWGAFLNALRTDPKAVYSAIRNAGGPWTERRLSEGGALVPENLRQQVLFYLSDSIIRPRAMVIPAETLRTGLPSLSNFDQSGGQQGLGGIEFSFVPDGAEIPATAARFDKVVLEAQKVAALITGVPNELLADASESMGDLLGRVIALGYGWFLDDLAINGTGAAEPLGLMYSPAAYEAHRNTASEVLHQDVVGMLKALHPASKRTATWLASEDTFDYLLEEYELVGSGTDGVVPPPNTLRFNSRSRQWELLGVPLLATDHQPGLGTAGDLVLADLGLMVIAERQAMEVEVSSTGAGFPEDASQVRIKGRMDMRYWPQQTYTLRNGKTCSPLVVLSDVAS